MQTAPYWAPDAIATKEGWVDPNTGELLMAIEGLVVVPTQPAPETTVQPIDQAPTE